ncbi:TPA: SDR family NAD(P)-dependent oxidoreductase [Elizabethkingia anophelis]
MESKNKYALITSATGVIGQALATQFARYGYDLILVARHSEELMECAYELKSRGINVIIISKNISLPEEIFSLYSELALNGISPEVFISIGGFGSYGRFSEGDLYEEINMINANINSVVILTKLFIKDRLPEGSGKILYLLPSEKSNQDVELSVYTGIRSFILSWAGIVSQELKNSGISMLCIMTTETDCDFLHKKK